MRSPVYTDSLGSLNDHVRPAGDCDKVVACPLRGVVAIVYHMKQ